MCRRTTLAALSLSVLTAVSVSGCSPSTDGSVPLPVVAADPEGEWTLFGDGTCASMAARNETLNRMEVAQVCSTPNELFATSTEFGSLTYVYGFAPSEVGEIMLDPDVFELFVFDSLDGQPPGRYFVATAATVQYPVTIEVVVADEVVDRVEVPGNAG